MKRDLSQVFTGFKNDDKIYFYDEIRIKQSIILNILNKLGWNTFDVEEVFPDYPAAGINIDYSLRFDNENKAIIIVKKQEENLEKFEPLVLQAAKQSTAEIAIVTNGIEWWFYGPSPDKKGEKEKFLNLNLIKQDAANLSKNFTLWLSKDRVIKGKSAQDAQKVPRSLKKKRYVRQALMYVWNIFSAGEDSPLLKTFAVEAEKLCGFVPDLDEISSFLKLVTKRKRGRKPQVKLEESLMPIKGKRGRKPGKAKEKTIAVLKEKKKRGRKPGKKNVKPATSKNSMQNDKMASFIGKKPKTFTFLNRKHEVKKWKEVLTNICNILSKARESEFEKVLEISGRKREYFSKNPDNLKEPRLILGTDIYVETNFNASNMYMVVKKILKSFGYTEDDIVVETK